MKVALCLAETVLTQQTNKSSLSRALENCVADGMLFGLVFVFMLVLVFVCLCCCCCYCCVCCCCCRRRRRRSRRGCCRRRFL